MPNCEVRVFQGIVLDLVLGLDHLVKLTPNF
jgi:hypothetical protein